MSDSDFIIFAGLFKEVYQKCFGHAITAPLAETESKLLCNNILDETGLSIGWKSVKNYSIFIADAAAGKKENPSVATLDTLARYVLQAPYTNEIKRKDEEGHHPYWFEYRGKYANTQPGKGNRRGARTVIFGFIILFLPLATIIFFKVIMQPAGQSFTDDFAHTDDTALQNNGWFVKAKDVEWWNKRNALTNGLTLYTLKGDSWPDTVSKPAIRNLLLREIPAECFTAEVHLENFIPQAEWQQAGVLLMEDTTFTGKSIRLSLAYNDYFGGMKRPKEILIQAISSLGNGFGKPEEIAHKVLFYPDSIANHDVLVQNFQNSALRIEKHGRKFRFLYAGGVKKNGAFKEIASQEANIKPKYIGLFAIRGFTDSPSIPVKFKFFKLTGESCGL
ncbi:MAG: hypothetical protein V4577_22725 [Bacteroidota bacterium]